MNIGRNDDCWCGSGKKWKKCHYPDSGSQTFDKLKLEYYSKYHIILKKPDQIAAIRRAGHLAAIILDKTCAKAVEGVTTLELNDYAHKLHLEAGAIPAPLGYGRPPYPKSICTSLNDVICHGIPDNTLLKEGDILNIDVTCILHGFFGDCSRMVVVGKTTPERALVVDTAYQCLMESIAILKPGLMISAIGDTIEACAAARGCSVVHQFVGHGVGINFHEAPQVLHHRNQVTIPLVPGMIFTIEPMINAGLSDAVVDKTDQWTARTIDGKPSAQWEHTLLITETGSEILTPWKL